MKKSDFTSLPKKAISAFKAFPKKQQIIFGVASAAGTTSLIIVPVASSIASRSDNHIPTYVDSKGAKADLNKKYFKANDKYFTNKDDAIKELKLDKISMKEPVFTDGKKYDNTLNSFGITKLTPEEINALKVVGSLVKVDNVSYTYFEQISVGNLDTPGFFETQPHDKAAIPFAIPTSLWTDGSGNYFTTEAKALDDAKANGKIIDYTSLPTLKDGDKVIIDNKDYFYFDTSADEDLANAGFFSKAPSLTSDAPVIKDADVTLKKDNNYFTTNDKAIEYLKNDASLTPDKKLVDFDKTKLNLKKGDKITIDGATHDVKEYLYSDTSINLDHPGWRLSTNVPSTKDDDNLAPNVWYGKLNDGSVGWTDNPVDLLSGTYGHFSLIHENQDLDLDAFKNGDVLTLNRGTSLTYYDAIPVATPGWYKVDTTFPAKNDDLVSAVSPVYNDGSSDQYFTNEEKLLTANGIKPYVYNAAAVPNSLTVDGANYTYKTQKNNASFKATTAGWYPVSGVNDSSVGPSYADLYSTKDSTGADFVNADKKEVFWTDFRRIIYNNEYRSNETFWIKNDNVTIDSSVVRRWITRGAPQTPFTRAFNNNFNNNLYLDCDIKTEIFLTPDSMFQLIMDNYNPDADKNKNLTYNGVEYKYFNVNDEVPLTQVALVFYNDQNNAVPNPLQNAVFSDSSKNFFSDSDKAFQHLKASAINSEDVEGEIYLDGEPVKWMKYYDENISPGFYSSVPASLDSYPDFDGNYQYWTNLAYGNNSIIVWTSKDELWNVSLVNQTPRTKTKLWDIPKTETIPNLTYFEHPTFKKLGLWAQNSTGTQPDITLETFNPKYQMDGKFYNDDNAVISDLFQTTTGVTDKTGDVLIDNQSLKYYEKTSPGTLQVPGLYLTRPEGVADNGQKYDISQIKYSTVNGEYETTSALALDEASYHKNTIDSQDHANKNIDGKQYIYFDLVAGEDLDKPGFFKVQPTNKTKEPELTSKLEDIYKSNIEKEFFTTEELSMQHDKITTKTVGYFDSAKKNYLEENFLTELSLPLNEKEITLDNKKYYWK